MMRAPHGAKVLRAGGSEIDWTILLGPFEMMAQQERVLRGEEETEAFELVAFEVEARALVRPRRTPLSRADVEEIVGGPI